MTIFGIKNCDTIKKSLKWFEARGVAHQFHDFRKQGLERELLERWVRELGVEVLLNKRGTTWRKLPDDQKENLDQAAIIDLLLDKPAMIKRPVIDFGSTRRVGFSKKDQDEIAALLGC
ncbi:MAG: ArsC family reductase [Alphaproteobacteria bacterium]|nr:MAG: ArsC family reductase [Alphaproteobacteria bacterium]